MKIVLIGYMGSGKSTVGRELSKSLGVQFIDLDEFIEASEKCTIPKLFEEKGEIYFRRKEYDYLKELLDSEDDFVLSTGGGTPCYGKNMEAILQATKNVYYLNVPINELALRLSKEKDERPLISNILDEELLEFIGKHLFERSFFYNQAHQTIYCANKKIEKLINEVSTTLV